jgi:hypothetical protein
VDSARWKEALCAIQLKSVATAGGWWSDSGLLLRRWSQAKGFHQSSCCFGGLIHDRVFRHAPQESQPLQRSHPRPCLDAKPHSLQRLRLLRRTMSTQSDEQLQERVRDFIDRKQPTAKRSLHSRLILLVQIWMWMVNRWIRVDWAEGRWLPWWNVRGRVYSFDSGSGYLGDRSGVGVVRQDFILPFLNTGPIKRLRPREKLAFKRQSAPLVSPRSG